ncbi:hypothetical protein L810_7200 [Burkholderia sp. AU4i]|nr:hypothetical protein L810_7200 [Burkholderia sp. AU4i]MDW9249319.1 hypothetical protein [Burkholderia cepacia]QOH39771.1 hypothetical protein C7S14_2996 [Burkholderia cepacia]
MIGVGVERVTVAKLAELSGCGGRPDADSAEEMPRGELA